MSTIALNLNFKSADEAHRDLIHRWLKQDYIAEWIHGAGLQSTLSGLEKWIDYPALNKTVDRALTLTQHWIGYDGETPFVYLLTSNVDKHSDSVYARHATQTGSAITLDIFMGNTNYLGKGIAATTIQTFLSDHFSDVTEIFIDPEKTNTKAVHVYQKAGFSMVDEFIAPWHPVPHYLMHRLMRH